MKFLRLLMIALTFSISLSALQPNKKEIGSFSLISNKEMCADCNGCRSRLSAAELLAIVQGIINNNIFLSPTIESEFAFQLQTIINDFGIVASGATGATGPAGPPGPAGATGATGAAGVGTAVLDFADFYALMFPNNAATVGGGEAVDFPQDGPQSGTGLITRTDADTFNLAEIGVYQILFQVSVSEAGQLVLALDSGAGFIELPYTVVGRATGASQIIGMALVQTTVINSLLEVRNPTGNSPALTITPQAGQAGELKPNVSAHLVITRLR